jgi:tetratricopeptide (TPR) repeat protein
LSYNQEHSRPVGVILDKLGSHTVAIEYFDKALAIDPHDVDALNNNLAKRDELVKRFLLALDFQLAILYFLPFRLNLA